MSEQTTPRADGTEEPGPIQCEYLRLTLFPKAPPTADADVLWKQITGIEPESVTKRPRSGEQSAEGPSGPGRLALSVRPGRLDWLLQPNAPTELPAAVLSIGPFSETFECFRTLFVPYLKAKHSLVRLAVGGAAMIQVQDRTAGYKKLAEYLPWMADVIEPGSTDFLFQLNRPRASVVLSRPPLMINRLGKWAVVAHVKMKASGITPDGALLMEPGQEELATACRTEFDINTSPRPEPPLPDDGLNELFLEMLNMANDLVTRGDPHAR